MASLCSRIASVFPTQNVGLDSSHKEKRRSSLGQSESVSFRTRRTGSLQSNQNRSKVKRRERRLRSDQSLRCSSSDTSPPGPPADGSHGERFLGKSLRIDGNAQTVNSETAIADLEDQSCDADDFSTTGSDGGDGAKKATMEGIVDVGFKEAKHAFKRLVCREEMEGHGSAKIQSADILPRRNQNISNGSVVENGAAVLNGVMNGNGAAGRSSQDNGSAGHFEPPMFSTAEQLFPEGHNGAALDDYSAAEQPAEILPFQSVDTNAATSKSLDHAETSSAQPSTVAPYPVVKEGADSAKAGSCNGSAYAVDKPADMPTPNFSTNGAATVSHDNGSATNHTKAAADREPAANVIPPAPAARSVTINASALAPPLGSQATIPTKPKPAKLKPAPSHDEGDAMVLHIGQALTGKKILVTGATGFLAKVLVETILRTQPDVGQLYLLIRGRNGSPQERLEKEVIHQPVFFKLKEKYGDKYEDFMMQKLTAVSGNIEKEGLDLSPADEELLIENLDVIVNSAATTTFDERYDVAIKINTKGPLHMIQFANKCSKMPLFAHVSTAYVNGKRKGTTAEKPFEYGQSLIREVADDEGRMKMQLWTYNMVKAWSILMQEWLKIWKSLTKIFVHSQPYKMMQPHVAKVSAMVTSVVDFKKEGGGQANQEEAIPALNPEQEIKLAEASMVSYELQYGYKKAEVEMKKLGKRRANEFGWQDTYVFTKAMGEQMIMKHKGKIHVVIIRPSVVESTSDGPVKGWIEGNRMLDPIVMSYAKGQLEGFLVDPATILDIIPVDIVANTILAVVTKHGGYEQMYPFVYQVASSSSNPLRMRDISRAAYAHFRDWPFEEKDGAQVIVKPLTFITSELLFKLTVWWRLELPLMIAKVPLKTLLRRKRALLEKAIQHITHMAEIYKPYVFYEGRFSANNSEKILTQVCQEEQKSFGYSVKDVDWYLYLMNIHFVGLRQFVYNWRGTSKLNPEWHIYLEPPKPSSEDKRREREERLKRLRDRKSRGWSVSHLFSSLFSRFR